MGILRYLPCQLVNLPDLPDFWLPSTKHSKFNCHSYVGVPNGNLPNGSDRFVQTSDCTAERISHLSVHVMKVFNRWKAQIGHSVDDVRVRRLVVAVEWLVCTRWAPKNPWSSWKEIPKFQNTDLFCSPRNLGEMIQFDEQQHIFQMGWNHQLASPFSSFSC